MIPKQHDIYQNQLKKKTFLAIIFFSIIAHFLYYLFILDKNSILTADSWENLALADSLRNKFTYSIDNVLQKNRGPGYPIFIFISKIFLNNIYITILFQILIHILSIVMIADIAWKINKIINNQKLFFILIFLVINIYSIHYSFLIMTETLYTFLIIFSLWSLNISNKNNKSKKLFNTSKLGFFLFGIGTSLCVLTRQASVISYLLFSILIFFLLLFLDKKNFTDYFKNIFFFLLSFALITSIWCVRNFINFKTEILTNPNATIMGYKTNIQTYNHYYDARFQKYLYSNAQPFYMWRPYQKPISVTYKYKEEEEDVKHAFMMLEKDVKIKKLNFPESVTLDLFNTIAEKRFQSDPFLYITAPLSRSLKLLFSPRIGAISQDGETGYSTSKQLFFSLTTYNLIYFVIFAVGIICVIKEKFYIKKENNYILLNLIFISSFIVGHIYSYAFLFPFSQSRYFIPIIPLYLIFFRLKQG